MAIPQEIIIKEIIKTCFWISYSHAFPCNPWRFIQVVAYPSLSLFTGKYFSLCVMMCLPVEGHLS